MGLLLHCRNLVCSDILSFRCLLLSNIKPLISKCLLSPLSPAYCSRSVSLGCCSNACFLYLDDYTFKYWNHFSLLVFLLESSAGVLVGLPHSCGLWRIFVSTFPEEMLISLFYNWFQLKTSRLWPFIPNSWDSCSGHLFSKPVRHHAELSIVFVNSVWEDSQ